MSNDTDACRNPGVAEPSHLGDRRSWTILGLRSQAIAEKDVAQGNNYTDTNHTAPCGGRF